MTHSIKMIFLATGLALCSYVGYVVLVYVTHRTPPAFEVVGLEQDGSYHGIVHAVLQGKSGYKVDNVLVYLDSKMLDASFPCYVGSNLFSLPLSIDTRGLEDGRHVLSVIVQDATHSANIAKGSIMFSVDNKPLEAHFVSNAHEVDQGRCLHLKLEANKRVASACVTFAGQQYYCYPENDDNGSYETYIPIDCQMAPATYPLIAHVLDDVGTQVQVEGSLLVRATEFQKSKLSASVQPDESGQLPSAGNQLLEEALQKWVSDSPKKKLWKGTFVLPCTAQRQATPFGEIRACGRSEGLVHKAVDIVNAPRAAAWAAQDGRVIIKDSFEGSGNVVVLDHGLGIFTIYAHLSEFASIEVGDFIKKGTVIGKVGKSMCTGGYHLHWEMRVNNTPIDPMQWMQTA